MTIVNSREFTANQEKYFDMALDEQVYIRKDDNMFLLYHFNKNLNDMNAYHDASVYDEVLEPDEDFRSALSADEFKEKALEMVRRVHKMYAKK